MGSQVVETDADATCRIAGPGWRQRRINAA
jgi:hypothetical protein